LPFAAQLSKPTTVGFGRKRETIKVRSSGFHYQLHIYERQFGDRYLTVAARHSISDASSNGLLKKPTAPPAIARLRRLSFGWAVIRITGVR
jgi:hypothetical protein